MKGKFAIGLTGVLSMCIIAVCAAISADEPEFKPSVEVHGYMLNRLYTPPGNTPRFDTERVSLSAIGHIAPAITGYVEVYFHPWVPDVILPNNSGETITAEEGRVYLESAYLDLPLGAGNMRIGKGRQLNFGLTPTYPNRKTTQYGILSELFTQDRTQGFQYTCKQKTFDGGASVFTDNRLESRFIGYYPNPDVYQFVGLPPFPPPVARPRAIQHFAMRDDTAENSGLMAGSIRVGISTPCLQAHLSGMAGSLLQTDADFIAAQYGITTTRTTHYQYRLRRSLLSRAICLSDRGLQGAIQLPGDLGLQPFRRISAARKAEPAILCPLGSPQ